MTSIGVKGKRWGGGGGVRQWEGAATGINNIRHILGKGSMLGPEGQAAFLVVVPIVRKRQTKAIHILEWICK